jgi:hypothetical protein
LASVGPQGPGRHAGNAQECAGQVAREDRHGDGCCYGGQSRDRFHEVGDRHQHGDRKRRGDARHCANDDAVDARQQNDEDHVVAENEVERGEQIVHLSAPAGIR